MLAIELMATQRVLLFAADAQVGNWLSWHEGGWSEVNGLGRGETLTAEDLLRRTVLYKVAPRNGIRILTIESGRPSCGVRLFGRTTIGFTNTW